MAALYQQGPVRIAIVDDHPTVLVGLRSILKEWSYGSVVLEALNGLEYERACLNGIEVDIAIVDLSMPIKDGYATISWIAEKQPRTLSLAFALETQYNEVLRAFRCGARGILPKTADKSTILEAMESLRTARFYFNELVQLVFQHTDSPGSSGESNRPHPRILNSLTRKEKEFLVHLCAPDNPSYAQVAVRMGISVDTIHSHRKHLFEKFGVDNRQGLFRAAKDWKLDKSGN